MNKILTAVDLKEARESLNLSQAKVAGETGINRSYLSQFESGQRVLTDEFKQSLLNFYISQGFESDSIPEMSADRLVAFDSIKLRDGFEVARETDDSLIEDWLANYHANSAEIESMLSIKDESGFFSDEEFQASCQKALALMARNYALVELIRGNYDLLAIDGSKGSKNTCRAYLNKTLFEQKEAETEDES